MRATLLVFSALFAGLASVPARARHAGAGTVAEERLIARCIQQSARGKPWLEKTLWGLRDQEGGWIGAEVRNRNGSHDLGPMQINSWWVPRIARLTGRPSVSVRQWLRDDACFNVEAARWIFLIGFAGTPVYWRAVGIYHSPSQRRQAYYAAAVAGRLARRYSLLSKQASNP